MNIFISYSGQDTDLVKAIADAIDDAGHEVWWWDERNVPGKQSWEEIFSWIDEADLVLAVITDNAISRAMAMGNEIGYAIASDKTIIPIVKHSVRQEDIGCLIGMTYVPLVEHDMESSIDEVLRSIKREKGEQFVKLAKGVLGIVAAIAIGRKLS